MLMLIHNGKYFTRKSELCMKVNFIEYLKFSLGFLTFQFYFMLVASNCCLKFLEIPENSQEFLASFQIYSLSGKVIGALSWNSQEFQALWLLTWNFWECLGIPRFLEPELRLRLGIPGNSQSEFTVKIHTSYSQEFQNPFRKRHSCFKVWEPSAQL